MNRYRKYKSYKLSGFSCPKKIPNHWSIMRLRFLGNCQNGVSKGAEYFGFGFPFVSYGDVYNNISLPTTVEKLANSSPQDRVNYSVEKGDVFFTRTSETIEEIGLTSTCLCTLKDAIFSGFLIRFRPNGQELDEGFSKYYFRADFHRRFFVKEMNLVTRASLNQDLLKNVPVVIPPMSEQQKIAGFLDHKVGKINSLSEKKKFFIKLLKEKRKTLIIQVITKGIPVNDAKSIGAPIHTEFKSSSSPLLGKIPKLWTTKKLKYIATIKGGMDQRPVMDEDGMYPIYGSGGIFSNSNKFLYDKVSVLLGRKGTIDKPLFVTSPFWTVDTMFYTEIKQNVIPKFFYYLCLTIKFDYYQNGSTVPSMTSTDLHNTPFALPVELREQELIVDYLDKKLARIDALIKKTEEAIKILFKYRDSLISNSVTGEIDVMEFSK